MPKKSDRPELPPPLMVQLHSWEERQRIEQAATAAGITRGTTAGRNPSFQAFLRTAALEKADAILRRK